MLLDELYKKLGCARLKWNTTDEKDYSAVTADELMSRAELLVGKCFEVELLPAIRGLVQVLGVTMASFRRVASCGDDIIISAVLVQ